MTRHVRVDKTVKIQRVLEGVQEPREFSGGLLGKYNE